MQITEILTPERTRCGVPGGSKKRVLEYLSNFLAEQDELADPGVLFEQLLARERLGSTGIGEGVAIPHCRLPGLDQTTGILFKLDEAVDFDAIDGDPVDLVFALVVPEEDCEEHLKTLASIAEMLQDPAQRARLRSSNSDSALYQAATAAQAA